MDESENPNPKDSNPVVVFLWFLLGMLPIPVVLFLSQPNAPHPVWLNFQVLLVFSIVCNVVGGIGCLRRVKDDVSRVILGFFLGLLFFIICCVTAVFMACSNMRID